MTLEAKSLAGRDEKRPDAGVAGDELCALLDWSRGTTYIEPAG